MMIVLIMMCSTSVSKFIAKFFTFAKLSCLRI